MSGMIVNGEVKHKSSYSNISSESYLNTILQEAYFSGTMNASDIENLQLQCLQLVARKSEDFSGGNSSSIRVELAESIMKSILYAIGMYLKALPNEISAIEKLKTEAVSYMFSEGRRIIDHQLELTRKIYKMVKSNRLVTKNYTYNATLVEGIKSFFDNYNPEYFSHEVPASIDYQLCNPIEGLSGVEFMFKYLQQLYLENEFCRSFEACHIRNLLFGYDEGYEDLLINIFEHVLTAALGCVLLDRTPGDLTITAEEVKYLYMSLQQGEATLELRLYEAAEKMLKVLDISAMPMRNYIKASMPKIIAYITNAVRTNTLEKTVVVAVNPDLKPKIRFESGTKMADEDYRGLVAELMACRFTSDRLALIRERISTFADLEDILMDAELEAMEVAAVLAGLEAVELAALIKRHPYSSEVEVDISDAEEKLRGCLRGYMDAINRDKRKEIIEINQQLVIEGCY